ncbi:hypothetical protein Bbelb_125490 [Branchiostoma belcheri]|nr:hypothetical protein Bbelb_125490 [Branchiostoma belcheri]
MVNIALAVLRATWRRPSAARYSELKKGCVGKECVGKPSLTSASRPNLSAVLHSMRDAESAPLMRACAAGVALFLEVQHSSAAPLSCIDVSGGVLVYVTRDTISDTPLFQPACCAHGTVNEDQISCVDFRSFCSISCERINYLSSCNRRELTKLSRQGLLSTLPTHLAKKENVQNRLRPKHLKKPTWRSVTPELTGETSRAAQPNEGYDEHNRQQQTGMLCTDYNGKYLYPGSQVQEKLKKRPSISSAIEEAWRLYFGRKKPGGFPECIWEGRQCAGRGVDSAAVSAPFGTYSAGRRNTRLSVPGERKTDDGTESGFVTECKEPRYKTAGTQAIIRVLVEKKREEGRGAEPAVIRARGTGRVMDAVDNLPGEVGLRNPLTSFIFMTK